MDDENIYKLLAVPYKIKKNSIRKENLDIFIKNEYNIILPHSHFIYIKQVIKDELDIISIINGLIEKI